MEPTSNKTLEIYPDQRKSISDVFFDCPVGFIGEVLICEAQYRVGTRVQSGKSFTGKSYQQSGKLNSAYYVYGKNVLATKDGSVVFVRKDVYENDPRKTNLNTHRVAISS